MRPREPDPSPVTDLFRNRPDNLLDQRHELYQLADMIDWQSFDDEFGALYCADNGCPARAMRLMVGLQYLKHMYSLSDDAVVMRWVENPYWQYFCGEEYFQHQLPIDPSTMKRFRLREDPPGDGKRGDPDPHDQTGRIEAGHRGYNRAGKGAGLSYGQQVTESLSRTAGEAMS